jgi:hypothetical protein
MIGTAGIAKLVLKKMLCVNVATDRTTGHAKLAICATLLETR